MREALLEAYRAADTHDTYYMVCLACTWAGKVAQALDTYKTLANGTPRLRPLDCHSVCTTHMLPAYATGTVHKDRQTRRQASLFAEVSANTGGHKEACGPRCHRRLRGVRQEAPPGRSRGPVAATEVTAASTMNARATVVPTSYAKVLATAVANEQQQRQS